MVATKEQERKALQKIREIVAGLGENSYVATALEGMFEDAEENIESDFALSMKSRYESAQAEIQKLADRCKELEEKALRFKSLLEKKDAEIEALEISIKEAQVRQISQSDGERFVKFLASLIRKYGEKMETTADVIVSLANDPNSTAFQDAVSEYKWMQYEKGQLNGLRAAIATAANLETEN